MCGCELVCIFRYSLLWVLSTSINSLKFLIVYTFISGLEGSRGINRDGERVRGGRSRTVKGAATFVVLCKMHKHSA